MSEGNVARVLSSAKSVAGVVIIVAMDHIFVFVALTTSLMFIVGSLLVSVPVGLLAAMVGSMGVLYVYAGFCQSCADQRGRRHA